VTVSLGPGISAQTGEHGELFVLTNNSRGMCLVRGYPTIGLYDHDQPLPFIYRNGGGLYVTHRAPAEIALRPGAHAYFLIAKYRCDIGVLQSATTARISLPGSSRTVIDLTTAVASRIDYCRPTRGDPRLDPGNKVGVSPIESALAAVSARQ
jgi:hypothetical protein